MNNNKPSASKSTIWMLLIIAAVVLGYYFFASNATPAATSLQSTDNATAAVGVRVLNLLNQIQSLKIDTKLFQDTGYSTLVDYSVVIPPVNVGRPNPFAPIPGLSAQSSTGSTR
ncbi:MAG TPA: hypothetical protein VL335_02460 [Candidatus Paceibacterota bacterium]|jgi:hypothetical protein|nr:hypothetical protein [Candidatus Paceibacterota bacterium]